jgi:hypothetical protein
MTSVFFALVPCPQADWEGEAYREFVSKLFRLQKLPRFGERYTWVDAADSADLVIVLEPVSFKTATYREILWQIPSVRDCPGNVFTINYDDAPLAFLPGIYAAMPFHRFEPMFTVAGCYLVNSPNQFVRSAGTNTDIAPEYLFTFRGSLSSPIRRRMSREPKLIGDGPRSKFTVVDAWFNHSDEQKRDYVDEILLTKFVLCPRGQGTVSHRLFETMELSRVPVIIADDWVEPDGPRWPEFSIRIPEAKLSSIPSILSERESLFSGMARLSRRAWEEYFAPEVRLCRMLDQLMELKNGLGKGWTDYRARWRVRRFHRGNVGPLWDRMRRRLGLFEA